MPADVRPFGQLFAEPTRNGLTRPKSVRGVGVKMVNMGELFAYSRLRNVSMDRVPLGEQEADRFLLKEGDLLFARQSLVLEGAGKCSIFLTDDEPVTFESHVTRVRLDSNKADPRFYHYYFQSPHGRAAVRSIVEQGAGASGIRGSDLEKLGVYWYPLNEQRAIAAVLGALDDKIEQNRRTARALDRLARAIFRAWFVDFEPMKAKAGGAASFPSMPQLIFNALPTRFVDSDIGLVPEGWEVKAITTIATFLNGLALQKYPPRGDGKDLRVIKIAELRKGSADGADRANGDVPEQYVIDDHDLLFSWSGTLEVGFWFGGKGALNQHLFKVTSSHFPSWFYLLWIRQHLPWFRAIAASKATTMGHIKRGHLQETQVVVPPEDVLREANGVIGSLYNLYAQLMIELRKLAMMRDLLLPNLLSGEVRVQVDGGANSES